MSFFRNRNTGFYNKQNKEKETLIEMPKMYSVNIPGVSYMQYSYIENLSINFIGDGLLTTRRQLISAGANLVNWDEK